MAAAMRPVGSQPLMRLTEQEAGGRSGFLMAATAQDSGRAAPIAPFLIKFMGFMTVLFVIFHLVHVHLHSQAVVSRTKRSDHAREHLLVEDHSLVEQALAEQSHKVETDVEPGTEHHQRPWGAETTSRSAAAARHSVQKLPPSLPRVTSRAQEEQEPLSSRGEIVQQQQQQQHQEETEDEKDRVEEEEPPPDRPDEIHLDSQPGSKDKDASGRQGQHGAKEEQQGQDPRQEGLLMRASSDTADGGASVPAPLEGLSGAPSGAFTGHFIMTSGWKPAGAVLKFPMKKLLNKLTHYSIGKVTPGLLSLLPGSDFLRERGRKGSCAVIGNGGSMLLYELGREIDRHDMVIRLNSGPAASFEKVVGNRTDVRLVNRLHLGFRETVTEPILQHVSTEDSLKQFISFRKKHAEAPMYLISMEFIEHAYTYIEKGVLSNGLYATLLASEMCEKVTLYGFLRDWRGKTRYHYYNQEEPDVTQTKRDDREELRMKMFMVERAVTHRYGEPCMTEAASSSCADGSGTSSGLPVPCRGCPNGTTCSCGAWHPIPLPGYCYAGQHPFGRGVPDVGCIRACRDSLECPGGLEGGVCPPEVLEDAAGGPEERSPRNCVNLR